MKINGINIENTYAEAFTMKVARLVITAPDKRWANIAATSMSGFATSVIACGCEAGMETEVPAKDTPDGRPGVAVLLFAMSEKELAKQLLNRVGQCILTCPGTACYDGFAPGQGSDDSGDATLHPLGRALRYFGDGYQAAKRIGNMRLWRIPVMDGEFVCTDMVRIKKGVGGGNILIPARTAMGALKAAEAAVKCIAKLPGVIAPFPGGIVRSGSKVGSRYPALIASSNDAWCPTISAIRDSALPSALPKGSNSVLEIVVDGVKPSDVERAMLVAMQAACRVGKKSLTGISAGNYGGNLGSHHFYLQRILKGAKA